MKIHLGSLLTATLVLCGCSTTASRQMFQASRAGHAEPCTYFLVTEQAERNQPSQTQRVLACVEAALAARGFTRTADPTSALQVKCEFGTDLAHVASEIEEMPVRGPRPSDPSKSMTRDWVAVEVRVPCYRVWIFLRTLHAGDPLSGWSVSAETLVPEDDISGVWPSLVAAAASLLAPDAPSESTVELGPDDPFVRAIAAGSSR